MLSTTELTVSQYADIVAISPADKAVLIKQHGMKVKKIANEWYLLLSPEFIIPHKSEPIVFEAPIVSKSSTK